MRKLVYSLCIMFMMPGLLLAQSTVSGVVKSKENGKSVPVPGAIVGWVGSTTSATTDKEGNFSIVKKPGEHMLYAAFLGLKADTLHVAKQSFITFTLRLDDTELDEVVVRDNPSASTIKKRDVTFTQLITAKELTKAACCNLSESFETNPAIDASFTDAVTGTRQIKLLGLDGPYSYYTRGNVPTMGGIASILGLQLIPGNWIQSIQLTKGSGSVLNGFESVSGQVNYELRQPDGREFVIGQLYGNAGGRLEQSVVLNKELNELWSTNLMLYGRQQVGKPDFNNDGFLDMPQGNLWIAQNTWKVHGHKGWESQFGFKYAFSDQTGGQIGALNATKNDTVWQAFMQTKRFEYWQKLGYVFKNSPYRSVGFQFAFNYHDQISDFGLPATPTYSGLEKNFYINAIYQDIIGTTDNTYKVGLSYKNQAIDEVYLGTTYLRREAIPGIFGEYTYLFEEKLSVVGGLRLDHHSQYGSFVTPRLHVRYEAFPNHTFRANAGKAYRTANLFADNIGSMASNRVWNISSGDEATPYGLKQEESINAGVSYSYTFDLDFRPGSISAEYFYTGFQNQIVKDWDASTTTMNLYNLDGQSYAHSAQVQIDYEVIQRLSARAAYRFVDAKTSYKSIGLARQPFISRHRVFGNLGYQSRSMWKFDMTVNWMSNQRLPNTMGNPIEDQRPSESQAFTTVNFQIAKEFRETIEFHIGAENAFNFMQPDPIVSVDSPFAPQFDASMIWAPIMGRVIYAGIRINLLKKTKN